jgi:hypothetical protein
MAEVLSAAVPTVLMLSFAIGCGLCIAYIFRGWLDRL